MATIGKLKLPLKVWVGKDPALSLQVRNALQAQGYTWYGNDEPYQSWYVDRIGNIMWSSNDEDKGRLTDEDNVYNTYTYSQILGTEDEHGNYW